MANHPFALWADYALKSQQMLLASAQVIQHRLGRLAAAGPQPNAPDRQEFARMGNEKIEAAAAAWQGALLKWMTLYPRLALYGWQQAVKSSATMLRLLASPAGANRHGQARLVALLSDATQLKRLSHAGLQVMHASLKPVHRAATANARRLANYKPR
ncbi:polyhydroxyalkanoate granule-associated phasin [Chitinimonas koreensis]|uniref:polyhydroxyalkanoate granule-associated phasin n=1 Tax=Chitinimonas koreensis TaxID=356302 RepID=UPI0003F595D1|nr:polyhydroxyalkanoate granule-associated phasin [Chitinimonas koreensis]QNM97443.1 hypothetical protein H9L41_03805 [Chitinimonas koreensis]